MTYKEIIDFCIGILAENTSEMQAIVKTGINTAQQEFCTIVKDRVRGLKTKEFDTEIGKAEYHIETDLSLTDYVDIFNLKRMTLGDEEGKVLQKADIRTFDIAYPDISVTSIRTIPTNYCIAEEKITINPPDEIYSMKMRYYYLLPNLVNDGDISKINPLFHYALVWGGLIPAFSYREEEKREQWCRSMFERLIGIARKFVKEDKDLVSEFSVKEREDF